MTGKVFAESSNIYDDQARILFDYYRKAAEKIVGEEVALENKIADAQARLAAAEHRNKVSLILMIVFGVLTLGSAITFLILWGAKGLFGALVFLVGVIVALVHFLKSRKEIAECASQIQGFTEAKNDIRRDYKMSKLGVAYVPVATRVPFEGKSFVVDHTGAMQNTDFSLSVLHKPEELKQSLTDLEEGIRTVPVVEGNSEAEQIDTSDYSLSVQNVTMHDYIGNIDRQVRNISFLLGDSDVRSVSLPVVPPESSQDAFIGEYATTETEGRPVVKVYNTDGFGDKLSGFTQLSQMKKDLEKNGTGDNSEYFKQLMKKLGETVQLVSQLKTNSTSRLMDYTNGIFAAVLKAGHNQYSPSLEAEEIERVRQTNFDYQDNVESYQPFQLKSSSRVRYDLFSGAWVAEDNSRTNMPFGMNQIEEEVLQPVIKNLMNETRIERLRIYNNIKDQKLSYLNKWHQDVEDAFRDNRKAGDDLITQLTNAYAEYNTAYQTYVSYKATQDSMKATKSLESGEVHEQDNAAELIAGFEMQAKQCTEASEQFQAYMERLQDDINAKEERFGHIEYYEASLRDSESRDIARSQSLENLQSLDLRRRRIVPVSTYTATYAEIPPEPRTEPGLMEDFTMNVQQIAEEKLALIRDFEAETRAATARETDSAQQSADGLQKDTGSQSATTPENHTAPQSDTAPQTPPSSQED